MVVGSPLNAEGARAHFPSVLDGKNCRIDLSRPRIMGILNVTPDSFSDGGCYLATQAALAHALSMQQQGADIIDIGGESTRPGAKPVTAQEEIDRVLPVIERLATEIDLPLSIDTSKSTVAKAAVAAGAAFVNDISGLSFDPMMGRVVAESGAGLFLMHTSDRPERMQQKTSYQDVVAEVVASLRRSLEQAVSWGIDVGKLAVDPGIGFGKDLSGNLELLRRLDAVAELGRPVLLGTSRKSFIGKVLAQPDPEQRLAGTLATVALAVARGGRLFRVHDVAPARDAARMAFAVCRGAGWQPA